MFATLFSATLFSFVAVQAVLASDPFTIDTPQLAQCGKATLTWSGGKGPYNVAVVPGDDPCGTVIDDLGDQDGLTLDWTVTLKEGTKVMLSVIDDNEDEAWSGEITVGGSKDASCLKAATTPSSGSGGSGASGTPGYTVVSNTGTASAAGSTGGAVAAGAANAGLIPGSTSGALSARQIPAAATAFAGIAVALVAFAL